ncbi:MAG TPA: bifunctional methylenetetrahydrofolate dehydrogenase/methenyltetrahydrofolate cyclohydrolase FolD [Bdellovibrionota bacterium]|nr:bifunctional methylenetetrahydrofolate dehydrogenase/methenyltetrahydrofolate cyclohydrolase FolD [Bdellovibrionota bacterium]
MAILDGKALAAKIHGEIKRDIEAFTKETGIRPGLAAVRVGVNEASRVYVNRKAKACNEVGIYSKKIELPEDTSEKALLEVVDSLNRDKEIHGILVQLPLPKQISTDRILAAVDVEKDVDGFHIFNVGRLAAGQPGLVPCTPLGVIRILEEYDIPIEGAEAVIVGRSQIVGKPVAQLLLARHATVTICHSRTKDLPEVCRRADILVAAIGKAEMIRGDWVKKGATVIDVGINRKKEDGTLVGDVAFHEAEERAGWITPVPGGVGPLTIAMLLSNTLKAAKERARIH